MIGIFKAALFLIQTSDSYKTHITDTKEAQLSAHVIFKVQFFQVHNLTFEISLRFFYLNFSKIIIISLENIMAIIIFISIDIYIIIVILLSRNKFRNMKNKIFELYKPKSLEEFKIFYKDNLGWQFWF